MEITNFQTLKRTFIGVNQSLFHQGQKYLRENHFKLINF